MIFLIAINMASEFLALTHHHSNISLLIVKPWRSQQMSEPPYSRKIHLSSSKFCGNLTSAYFSHLFSLYILLFLFISVITIPIKKPEDVSKYLMILVFCILTFALYVPMPKSESPSTIHISGTTLFFYIRTIL